MLQTAKRDADSASPKAMPHERYLGAFRWMLLTRIFEDKLSSLYRGGMITDGVYLGRGQEAVSTAFGVLCERSTFVRRSFAIRPRVAALANRSSPCSHLSRLAARADAWTRCQRPRWSPRGRATGDDPDLGAMISVVAGKRCSRRRLKGETGSWAWPPSAKALHPLGRLHEGLNIASWRRSARAGVANDHYAYSTPSFACSLPAPTWSIARGVTGTKATKWTAPIWPRAST